MSCINPNSMSVTLKYSGTRININTDCNHCMPCLVKKQSQITFLCNKELLETYKKGLSASFVTLTYDDKHLPINERGFVTLQRSDVQKFIKRMRRNIEYHGKNLSFKYIYCGEYGDGTHSKNGLSTRRPHYHLIIFGLSPEQVRFYTKKLWRFGLCDIGVLGAGGIRYLCKYMAKSSPSKDVKKFREVCCVQNPFFYHSIGIGKEWILKNLDNIVHNEFTFNLNGKKYLFPKYVLRFVSAHTGINYIPYVRKFLKNEAEKALSKGISYSKYDYENSFLKHKTLISSLRSQGKPIDDITLSKKWCRPFHSLDRVPDKKTKELAEFALYGDVVPF